MKTYLAKNWPSIDWYTGLPMLAFLLRALINTSKVDEGRKEWLENADSASSTKEQDSSSPCSALSEEIKVTEVGA